MLDGLVRFVQPTRKCVARYGRYHWEYEIRLLAQCPFGPCPIRVKKVDFCVSAAYPMSEVVSGNFWTSCGIVRTAEQVLAFA